MRPATESLLEIMGGCGTGCDFEATLMPLRYYPCEKIQREVAVNVKLGAFNNAWLHTGEVFAYQHCRNFESINYAEEMDSVILHFAKTGKPARLRFWIPVSF